MARTRGKRGASRLGERPAPASKASRRRKATIGEATAIAGRAGLNPKSEATRPALTRLKVSEYGKLRLALGIVAELVGRARGERYLLAKTSPTNVANSPTA